MDFAALLPLVLMGLGLGFGLAMDAFSVSLANGLNEPCMKKSRMSVIAGTFAAFQFAMPMLGWICVSTVAKHFRVFQKAIPYIALLLLCYIGIKMIAEGVREKDSCPCEKEPLGAASLVLQGIATSIDALSVGFTVSDYNFYEALFTCLIIGVLTFFICFSGLFIGKKAGTRLAGKAGILGGAVLVLIGIEIFVTSLF